MIFTKNYKVHDENNTSKVGDVVTIVESRPISSSVRFTLDKVVEEAK